MLLLVFLQLHTIHTPSTTIFETTSTITITGTVAAATIVATQKVSLLPYTTTLSY